LPLVALLLFVLSSASLGSASPGDSWGIPHLRVVDSLGRVLIDIPLAGEAGWIVEWNHSVTGILVSDYYRFEGGRMLLTATHAPAFDAGLGHIPGRGRLESDDSHGYWIRDIDEPVAGNAYLLRVGSPRVNHRIVHDGTTYSLSELAAGLRVTVEVVR
jgi:hypothetical protein